MERYEKNGIFSAADMIKLRNAKVCIVGCGGLGGYVIEMLARAGIGYIKVIDGDVFDKTNLNRQLLSHMKNIGSVKVHEAKKRLEIINPDVTVEVVHEFLNRDNADAFIKGCDVVIDALDQIPTRFILCESCSRNEIPMIYGAIAGWYAQIATILPGDDTLSYLYPDYHKKKMLRGVEEKIGNPSFTPALAASVQVSECLKLILSKGELLINQLMYIDLLDNEMLRLPIKTK